ncbi:tRNA(Ile)-lysidine synthase [Desulfofundulus kuznetsovii DSM 6115]|uniref:tRNA(Ile)-lysidine synthase n=1 Tax=Desulfofundulus kuznetsovii (strain DSM 6115 / VKM B-1805 / 17) TaxID=760568 RepID=A0AAU8PTA8_DESK7|nr:tRNA(Ile)-lysidine synthase [Desulfofundulus kuznetsovii DSM 6115]
MALEQNVRIFMDKFHMISPGDKVLVGVSGGPDSVALLHLLWRMKEELQISLAVAHLNHMFRGEEARADARLVEGLAKSLGLPVHVEEFDVPAYRERTGLSAQDAARRVRYRFFEEVARRTGASRVALGHHADDQAETILFNFLRGTGLAGLKGIPPVRGKYIRPLLDIRRREIEDYCREHSLPVREDASNKKTIYTRNRIRLELIPRLEADYNPRLVDALVHLGHICREENDYLEEQAALLYGRALKTQKEHYLLFAVTELLSSPPALVRRVLRRAWRHLTGEVDLSYLQVESLLALLHNPAGGKVVELPRGVRASRQGQVLRLWIGGDAPGVPDYSYPLEVPGITYIPEINSSIKARLISIDEAPDPRFLSAREALLDYDTLPGLLAVRRRRDGDRFHPLGMPARTKLKKFLIEQGIPRQERDCLPLVVAGDEIIWVGGVRPGEPWKVTPETKRCLYLQILEGKVPGAKIIETGP